MKQIKIISFFLLLVIFFPKNIFGQDTAQYKIKLKKNYKQEIVINNQRFRIYNNWYTVGGGLGANTSNPHAQTVLGLNMNFHIHQYYFRLGGMISGDNFGLWNNYQAPMGWIPYRKETEKYNLAMITAFSYCTGYKYLYPGAYDNMHPYAEAGGYVEIQWIKKIQHSVGIGGAFFVDVNAKNTIIGIRADLYLSDSYKGYVKGKEPVRPQ